MNARCQRLAFTLLGIPAAFFVFSPALFSGYFADDFALIRSESILGDPGVESAFYRPACMFVFWLFDKVLFSGNPLLSHSFSVLVHWGNALLVYAVTKKLFAGHSLGQPLPLASAALFLTYPRHTEAVIWMAARGDLLYSLFVLVALVLVLKHWDGQSGSRHQPISPFLIGSWLSFLLSLLSKESGVVLLPILACLLYFLKDQKGMRLFGQLLPFAVILGLYLFVRARALGQVGGYEQVYKPVRVAAGFFVQLISLVVPGFLDFSRYGQTPLYSALLVVLALVALCLVFAGIWLLIRLGPTSRLVVVLLVLSLGPPVGIFTLSYSANDRVLYIPSVWLCIGIALLVLSFVRTNETSGKRAVALISACFALMSFMLSVNWHSAGRLRDRATVVPTPVIDFESVRLAVVPHNYMGVYMLAPGAGQFALSTGATIDPKGGTRIAGLVLLNVEARNADFTRSVSMLTSSEEAVVTAGDDFSFRATPGAYSLFQGVGLQATFDEWRGTSAAKVLRLKRVKSR
jgi:hypothetical protein